MSTYAQYQGYIAFAATNLEQGLRDIRAYTEKGVMPVGPLTTLMEKIRHDEPQINPEYFTYQKHVFPIFQNAATNYLLEHFDSQVLDKVT